MLSFMKENNAAGTFADGGSDFAPQDNGSDILVPSGSGKNVKQTTIILMVLFTIGAGCLWFMIKKTAPDEAQAAAQTEELQIETAIAQITGIKAEMNQDLGKIVEKFNKYSDVDQVAVNELKKNPFKQEFNIDISNDTGQEEAFNRNRMAAIRNKVTNEASQLKLQSLMANGSNPCCMVNDKLYNVGDKIGEFEVVAIHDQSLDLISNGIKVSLRMP